jgi:hypothetical protein
LPFGRTLTVVVITKNYSPHPLAPSFPAIPASLKKRLSAC